MPYFSCSRHTGGPPCPVRLPHCRLLISVSLISGSDIVGRRPVILAGVAGITITTVMLGFSKTFAGVLIARGLAGMASGNGPVISTVVCEITDATNQAYAFPFLGIWWPFGQILGYVQV